jgi:hypothetical protein
MDESSFRSSHFRVSSSIAYSGQNTIHEITRSEQKRRACLVIGCDSDLSSAEANRFDPAEGNQ